MCTSVYAFSNDPFDIRASSILPFYTVCMFLILHKHADNSNKPVGAWWSSRRRRGTYETFLLA